MKKLIKSFIVLCVIGIILIVIALFIKFNLRGNNYLNKYDIVITRNDINCFSNTIYLKKDEINIVYYQNDKKQEIVKINENIDIDKMINYVKENGKKDLRGLEVTLKDGTKKVISGKDNIIADFLKENYLLDSFCERKISSNLKALKCLENELGGYIVTEKDVLTDIPLDEITNKVDDIIYYKGVKANDNNMYVIVEGINDAETLKDFKLYFSKRFTKYQFTNIFNDIYVLIHNSFNDVDFSRVQNGCRNIDDTEGESLSMITMDKLNRTNKIVIKSGDNKLGIIDKQESIDSVLEIVISMKKYGDFFLCDGESFDLEMYSDKDELIDIIYLWLDGRRLIPKSVHNGCLYYISTNQDIDLRKIIEQETDYVFYTIFDYSKDSHIGKLELIYEDEIYGYYLVEKSSDEIMINFTLDGLTMTLKEALNKNYITPKQLEEYSYLLIKKEK